MLIFPYCFTIISYNFKYHHCVVWSRQKSRNRRCVDERALDKQNKKFRYLYIPRSMISVSGNNHFFRWFMVDFYWEEQKIGRKLPEKYESFPYGILLPCFNGLRYFPAETHPYFFIWVIYISALLFNPTNSQDEDKQSGEYKEVLE